MFASSTKFHRSEYFQWVGIKGSDSACGNSRNRNKITWHPFPTVLRNLTVQSSSHPGNHPCQSVLSCWLWSSCWQNAGPVSLSCLHHGIATCSPTGERYQTGKFPLGLCRKNYLLFQETKCLYHVGKKDHSLVSCNYPLSSRGLVFPPSIL